MITDTRDDATRAAEWFRLAVLALARALPGLNRQQRLAVTAQAMTLVLALQADEEGER